MKAETQRGIIIVLLMGIIGILLFPDKIRQMVLEVTATETGAARTTNQSAPDTDDKTIRLVAQVG